MKNISTAYWAGIFDGEGCVGIYEVYKKKAKNPSFYGVVAISSTNREIIEYLKKSFEGSTEHKEKNPFQNKDSWTWKACGVSALLFLKKVSPYLIIKKEQSLLAIRFLNHQKKVLKKVKGSGLSIKELLWRRSMRDQMRLLVSKRSNKGNHSFKEKMKLDPSVNKYSYKGRIIE